MSIYDHLFVLAVVIAFPIYARHSFAAAMAAVRRGGGPARRHIYRSTIATWLVFALIAAGLWTAMGRDWAAIGISLGDPVRQAYAALAAAMVIVLFALPLRRAVVRSDGVSIADELGDVFVLMPKSARDQRWFRLVALNAGITEEFIMRGYLLWYLSHYVDVWIAAIIAVVAFAFGHIYQGVRQMPGLLLVSAIAVGLYLYTESLLIPVIFHVVHDVVQGHYLAKIRIAAPDVAGAASAAGR